MIQFDISRVVMFETIKENGFPEEFEGRNVPKSWEMLLSRRRAVDDGSVEIEEKQ